MASIQQIKASDGSGNASVATVQSSRSPLASTIVVDTVLGFNTGGFAGSMGTPHTFTDPVTSETITVISEATCVDFVGHIDGSNIEIDTIAPGYTDAGSQVGDIVIIRPTTQWSDNVAAVLETSHDDDGGIKAGIIENANFVTTPGEPGGAWKSFTPTWGAITSGSNTLGNGTLVGYYTQVGKTIHFYIKLVWGSTTSSTGLDWCFAPPVTPNSNFTGLPMGNTVASDTGVNEYLGDVRFFSTTQIQPRVSVTSGAYATNGAISHNAPFTFASGDSLLITGTYEAA